MSGIAMTRNQNERREGDKSRDVTAARTTSAALCSEQRFGWRELRVAIAAGQSEAESKPRSLVSRRDKDAGNVAALCAFKRDQSLLMGQRRDGDDLNHLRCLAPGARWAIIGLRSSLS